jgi:hypothetical protein
MELLDAGPLCAYPIRATFGDRQPAGPIRPVWHRRLQMGQQPHHDHPWPWPAAQPVSPPRSPARGHHRRRPTAHASVPLGSWSDSPGQRPHTRLAPAGGRRPRLTVPASAPIARLSAARPATSCSVTTAEPRPDPQRQPPSCRCPAPRAHLRRTDHRETPAVHGRTRTSGSRSGRGPRKPDPRPVISARGHVFVGAGEIGCVD